MISTVGQFTMRTMVASWWPAVCDEGAGAGHQRCDAARLTVGKLEGGTTDTSRLCVTSARPELIDSCARSKTSYKAKGGLRASGEKMVHNPSHWGEGPLVC